MVNERSKIDGAGMANANPNMAEKEDIDKGSERVFPGGPTQSQIEDWKRKYGKVFMTKYDEDEYYIWRTLSRIEFKKILNQEGELTDWSREERVSETCVIWPENYDHDSVMDGNAGTPAVLAEEIMNKSGFMPQIGAKKL